MILKQIRAWHSYHTNQKLIIDSSYLCRCVLWFVSSQPELRAAKSKRRSRCISRPFQKIPGKDHFQQQIYQPYGGGPAEILFDWRSVWWWCRVTGKNSVGVWVYLCWILHTLHHKNKSIQNMTWGIILCVYISRYLQILICMLLWTHVHTHVYIDRLSRTVCLHDAMFWFVWGMGACVYVLDISFCSNVCTYNHTCIRCSIHLWYNTVWFNSILYTLISLYTFVASIHTNHWSSHRFLAPFCHPSESFASAIPFTTHSKAMQFSMNTLALTNMEQKARMGTTKLQTKKRRLVFCYHFCCKMFVCKIADFFNLCPWFLNSYHWFFVDRF